MNLVINFSVSRATDAMIGITIRHVSCFLVCFCLRISTALHRGLRGSETSQLGQISCRITLVHSLYLSEDNHDESAILDTAETICIPLVNGEEGYEAFAYDLDNIPLRIWQQHSHQIEEGLLHVSITNVLMEDTRIRTTEDSIFTVLEADAINRRLKNGKYKPLNDTAGVRSIAIVSVSTTSGERVSYSAGTMKRHLFDKANGLAGQYRLCSMNLLQWKLAGFFNVVIEGSISDYESPSHARNVALEQLVKKKIVKRSPRELGDHVMVVLPKGTTKFIANAGMNYWLSTYNDVWSLDLVTVIHELGHNIGLGHAGWGNLKYGDFSSYMSATSRIPELDSPLKCFNGAEFHQLGWFKDRMVVVKPKKHTQTVQIAAFPQWDRPQHDYRPLLVDVADCVYLVYNRAYDYNEGTLLYKDTVTVARDNKGSSTILGGLQPGGPPLKIEGCGRSGRAVWVQACEKMEEDTNVPETMTVAYGYKSDLCEDDVDLNQESELESLREETMTVATAEARPATTISKEMSEPPFIIDSVSRTTQPKTKERYGVISHQITPLIKTTPKGKVPAQKHSIENIFRKPHRKRPLKNRKKKSKGGVSREEVNRFQHRRKPTEPKKGYIVPTSINLHA